MAFGNSILDRARSALSGSPISVLKELTVEQCGESLVISGQVDTFYHKQMAQEVIRAACQNVPLKNSVDVS